ncbi:MAG: PEGA domain-containing protein, partial [Candidatus Cloacimonadota bacterium]
MIINKIYKSKLLVYSLIFYFLLLITSEATPDIFDSDSNKGFKPVVRVKEGREEIPAAQKDRFDKLFEEGKKLYQEEMDYEGAIEKFNEALDLAVTRAQKADVFYHLSLAHYGDLSEKGRKELFEVIRKLIEVDYYRELDELLCPPKYIELFEGIKKEYGTLKVQSKPAGADVYLNDATVPVGKTPLTIVSKPGSVKIKIKRGNKVKKDILKVVAGKETASSIYALKGVSALLYVLGGIVLAAGAAAALLLKSKAGEEGQTTGSIQVNSTPQGASIYLDGTDTGETTNSTLSDVSAGSHTVKLVKEGYEDFVESISVTAGQTTTVNASLTVITITVTNPTSSTIWIKGSDVEIRWGSSGSLSFQGNVRKNTGLSPLSLSGRNLSPSFRRRTLRSKHSFRNLIRTRRELDNRSNMGSSSIKE